jgi:Domain of unknown function (DUF4430)
VFRRLIILAVAAAVFAVLVPSALALQVKVRVEGKTTTIFGAAAPTINVAATALDALDAASARGEFYYHVKATSFGPYIDQIGRYQAEGANGWSFKVNGVSILKSADQATLEDGDTVLWYWNSFTEQGGSPTLVLKRGAKRNCYVALSQDDLGKTTQATGTTLVVGKRRVPTRAGRACVGRHSGLVRAIAPNAVRSNALS